MRRHGLAAMLAAALLVPAMGFAMLPATPATTVSKGGVTLKSGTIVLPDETARFPEGAAGELITNNCTACHSAEMILVQPKMAADKWQGEIDKMRSAYHAQVSRNDDATLVVALTGLQEAAAVKP
jgi:hypothetical protein